MTVHQEQTNSKVLYLIQLEHPMATKLTHATVLHDCRICLPLPPNLVAKVANLNFYSGQDCYGPCVPCPGH